MVRNRPWAILLVLFFSLPAFGETAALTLLGPLKLNPYPEDSGPTKEFKAGDLFHLVKVGTEFVRVEKDGIQYRVEKPLAAYYFESGIEGRRFLLEEALNDVRRLDALLTAPCCVVPEENTPSACYWKNKNPGEWDARTSRLSMLLCPEESVKIVKRESDGKFDETCRNTEDPPPVDDKNPSWRSCAPPPKCGKTMDAVKRLQAEQRRLRAVAGCTNQPKPAFATAEEEICLLPFKKDISKIVVHQSDGYSNKGANAIFNWHRDRGFDDMSYHFIIGKDASGKWRVFEGRPLAYEGAHGGPGSNSDSIGIAIAGCFGVAQRGADGNSVALGTPTSPCNESERPPPEAVRLLGNLVAKLKKEVKGKDGKPSIKKILGHGEHRFSETHCNTDCPSPSCQMLVNALRDRHFSDEGDKP